MKWETNDLTTHDFTENFIIFFVSAGETENVPEFKYEKM